MNTHLSIVSCYVLIARAPEEAQHPLSLPTRKADLLSTGQKLDPVTTTLLKGYTNDHAASLLTRKHAFDCLYVWEMQPALQANTVKLTEGFPAGKADRLMKACAAMSLEASL